MKNVRDYDMKWLGVTEEYVRDRTLWKLRTTLI